MDKSFAKTLKTSFLGLFEPSESIRTFFQKPGPVTYLTICPTSSKKIRKKNSRSRDLALQTDGKTNKAKFIGHFFKGGCPTSCRTT